MRRALLSLAFLALSCGGASSSSSTPPAEDPNAPPEAKRCGDGPWVKVSGTVQESSGFSTAPKAAVLGTVSLCPDKSFRSGISGAFELFVTKDAPLVVRLEHPDLLTMLSPELKLSADLQVDFPVPTKSLAGLVPDFGPTSTAILVGISPAPDAAGACAAKDGVKVSVPGHAEAKVSYFGGQGIPSAQPSATATEELGLAVITGLPDGVFVEIAGEKTGCVLTGQYESFTGRVKTGAGAVAVTGIRSSNK